MEILSTLNGQNKLIVFDLDNTLLEESFIDVCAARYNFRQALALVRQIDDDSVSLSRRLASFLRDRKRKELLEIADDIALIPGTTELVSELKGRGHTIGIISNSYQFVTHLVAGKIGADFELANELVFIAGSATGEVLVPSYFHYNSESTCRHQVCKTNALRYICKQYRVKLEDCIVVGEDQSNACMMEQVAKNHTYAKAI